MAPEIKQQPGLRQRPIMGPKQQQALKILHMPRQELINAIEVELLENPVLEEDLESIHDKAEEDWEPREPFSREQKPSLSGDSTWERFASDYRTKPYYDMPQHKQRKDPPPSKCEPSNTPHWADYLISQLRLLDLDETSRRIGFLLIGNLKPDGYLQADLDGIAEECGVSSEEVEQVLRKIHEFDPPGIAARNPQECLLIQIRHRGMEGTLADRIVKDCLKDLEYKRIPQIAKTLSVSVAEVLEAVEWIKGLEPNPWRLFEADVVVEGVERIKSLRRKPGRHFRSEEPYYMTPDVFVFKLEDDYVIFPNEDGLLKYRISHFYRRLLGKKNLSEKDRAYIQEKIRSGEDLSQDVQRRQHTIRRVTESIMRFQREFLDHGIEHLQPLVMKDVALDIGLSESAISKAVNNKYVDTPRGLFELKYFFSAGIQKDDGESIASKSVMNRIQMMIEKEDSRKPLSDQEIADRLAKEGIQIERRLVNKYRNVLRIPTAGKRKRRY